MILAKPNNNNDLNFDKNGDFATAEDEEAIAILTKQRVQTLKGECMFEPDKGIDYFGMVFTATPNYTLIRGIFRAEIEGTVGVRKVTKLGVRVDRNTISYYAEAVNDMGVTIVL